ncbi:suppressor of lurcher protein 1-like [Planococcus citri]|uniref:suppressor of lurcher protein 1-like n=1 Tax=Planococcus citri TaxID=170843 RepID=UPI0031F82204
MHSISVILTFVTATVSAREITKIFDSSKMPSGSFYSRWFPYSYNSSDVEMFYFRGHQDEKVQITFDKFNLFSKGSQNERCGLDNSDSFISYKKTDRSTDWERFCGNHKPLPIMSEEEQFSLRYEPVVVPANNLLREQNQEIGFNASFRFVKNYGIDFKIPPNDQSNYGCDFTYDSTDYPNGTFNSPNFPGMYPTHILCYYTFRGVESNIFFNFTHFNLIGSTDCNEEIEKKDKLQVLTSSDGNADDKREYCGNHTEIFNITITNRTAFIIFYHQTNLSDVELANYEFVGFSATFLFTNETVPNVCDHKIPSIGSICVCLYLLFHKYLHFQQKLCN